jgi:hypothetical protein
MIAFQTLFLGLVFGTAPVRLMVSPPVTRIEVFLDGTSLGMATAEPWDVACDFGPAPLPHELVAVGRDAGGKEVARIRQRVNLPRAGAEARIIVLRPEPGKPATARLSWSILDNTKPRRFTVTVDGESVPVKDPQLIVLPAVDLTRPHFIAAEVAFSSGILARAESSFGGDTEAEAASELTAFPVVLRPGAVLPSNEAMGGWFRAGGQHLGVVGVEEGFSDTVVVFDQDSNGRFRGISRAPSSGASQRDVGSVDPAKGGNRLSALWALAKTVKTPDGREVRGLFPLSIPLDLDIDELRRLIFNFASPTGSAREQALANAVATAGMQAAALNRRRAVVLIVGEASPDASTISVKAAREYLESINVPLFVWTPERRIAGLDLPGWGRPDDISTNLQLQGAMTRLERALQAQRIFWLRGSHLPSAVTIFPGVQQIFYARGVLRQQHQGEPTHPATGGAHE